MATRFRLAAFGHTMEVGRVVEWKVSEGDKIKEGDEILSVETDKAVVEMPATATGVVEILHVEVGQEVKIGQPIVTLNDQAESKPEITDKASEHIEAKDKSKNFGIYLNPDKTVDRKFNKDDQLIVFSLD